MAEQAAFPWLQSSLSLLDLRRRDRVLLLAAGAVPHARAIAELVGSAGSLAVVEADPALAERIAGLEHPSLQVMAHAADGSERFGTFDALLSCPLGLPPWPVAAYGPLLRRNLRPGGRFVLDLPAPETSAELAAAVADAGMDAAALAPLSGPAAEDVAAALRAAGLREVHATLGAHLLDLHSPHDLLDLLGPALPAAAGRWQELGLLLAHRLRGTAEVQALVHRSRVHGLR